MRWYQRFFRRELTEKHLDTELRFHLDQRIADLVAGGMSPEEACRRARLEFGGLDQVKEECRDVGVTHFFEVLIQDVRYGMRMLYKNPGFTFVAVLTLTLGIGANTAIFSLMNAVLLRELPVQNPSELVLFGEGGSRGSAGGFNTDLYSYLFYREMRQKNQVFSEVSATLSIFFERMHGAVGGSANLEPINVQLISGTYFPMLDVKPILGRAFTQADDEPTGGHPVAVVSYSWWKRRFNRDPAVVGKTVKLGSTLYSIIGVAPPEFFGTTVGESPDLWIPLSMEKQVSPGWNGLDDKWFESLYILARLKPGVSPEQAQANVNLLARQIWHEYTGPILSTEQREDLERVHIELTPAARGLSRLRFEFSLPLQILMAVVGLVLLIACANIANLLLARASVRHREIAVRMAIGAGRARLVRQMLTESLLIAFAGGALGVLFASWASEVLLAMVSAGAHPLPLDVSPDGRVLVFTFLISLVTAVLFGAVPAVRATRVDLMPALKEGRGGASLAGCGRLARTLIVSQVALSLVLLIGAGLFLRTLGKLAEVDTGFNQERVLLFSIDPADVGYKQDARLASLYQQIEQRVSALPGVRSASISFFTFNQGEWGSSVVVQGGPPPEGNPIVNNNVVGPEYFATMGIPLLFGRAFGLQDTATSPKVAVINETMAREFFPGGSPLGRHFGIVGDDPQKSSDLEVVGVVKDAKYESLRERPQPAAYYPYTQHVGYYNNFEVRYSGDPRAIIAEVRRAVGEVDRNLPITYGNTLAQQVERSITSETLVAQLSTFFGLLAAFLVSIGIYGLMSYAVSRRTNEIGVRMALGAPRHGILWIVLGQTTRLIGIGIAIGLPCALAANRLIVHMLFGVPPADPLILAAVPLALLTTGLAASYIPAHRATKVDPMVALRYE